MEIKIAYIKDAVGAFMSYALTQGRLDTGGLKFKNILEDVETLNQKALAGAYEVSSVSLNAYPKISDQYYILNNGGRILDGAGPVLVSAKQLRARQLKKKVIAVPATTTTAFLVLKMIEPGFGYKIIPSGEIIKAVKEGRVDAGLLIYEDQINYEKAGLTKVVDIGQWWKKEMNLPLPVGINVVRRDLDLTLAKKISDLMHASVKFALDNKDEALGYASQFSKLSRERLETFVGTYITKRSLEFGRHDRRAIKLLFEGIINLSNITFLDDMLKENGISTVHANIASVGSPPAPPAAEAAVPLVAESAEYPPSGTPEPPPNP